MKKIKKRVIVANSIYKNLVYISKNSKIEECGIFLGRYDGNKFEIIKIVQDHENQFGTENSTVRQTKNIYEEYREIINKDNSIDYIGEWHTHPTGKANPSYFDNTAMKFLLNHPKYSNPTELILGIINPKDGLRAFLYQFGLRKIKEIKIEII